MELGNSNLVSTNIHSLSQNCQTLWPNYAREKEKGQFLSAEQWNTSGYSQLTRICQTCYSDSLSYVTDWVVESIIKLKSEQ